MQYLYVLYFQLSGHFSLLVKDGFIWNSFQKNILAPFTLSATFLLVSPISLLILFMTVRKNFNSINLKINLKTHPTKHQLEDASHFTEIQIKHWYWMATISKMRISKKSAFGWRSFLLRIWYYSYFSISVIVYRVKTVQFPRQLSHLIEKKLIMKTNIVNYRRKILETD